MGPKFFVLSSEVSLTQRSSSLREVPLYTIPYSSSNPLKYGLTIGYKIMVYIAYYCIINIVAEIVSYIYLHDYSVTLIAMLNAVQGWTAHQLT